MLRSLGVLVLVAAPILGQTLYLADSNIDQLFSVDPATGAATLIGSTGAVGTPAGLAHDGIDLFTLDLGGTGLYRLDTSTGAPTLVAPVAPAGWQDITWDPSTGQFFAVNQNNTLYSISIAGVATLIGSTPSTYLLTGLAVDSQGTLWAIAFFGTGTLGTLDKTTGAFTVVQTTTVTGIQGMSFDPSTGLLYGTNTNNSSLYQIDTNTGAATLVGAHGAGVVFAKGLSFGNGSCLIPQYQVNSLASSFNLDLIFGTTCSPALRVATVGATVTANFASTNVGLGFELVLSAGMILPRNGGAIVTATNQLFAVDLAAPGLVFLNGGGAPEFGVPFPGPFGAQFLAPSGPLEMGGQMINLDAASAEGFTLSQPCRLRVP